MGYLGSCWGSMAGASGAVEVVGRGDEGWNETESRRRSYESC